MTKATFLAALLAVGAVSIMATQASGQADFTPRIVGAKDDAGRPAVAVELSMKIYKPLADPEISHGIAVDIDVHPGSAEEAVLRYIRARLDGDSRELQTLLDPGPTEAAEDEDCNCRAPRPPRHHVPDDFTHASFQQAWRLGDLSFIQVEFPRSAFSFSRVVYPIRARDGAHYIVGDPDDPVYRAVSYVLRQAERRRYGQPTAETSREKFSHSVEIVGGASPITLYFNGLIHSSDPDRRADPDATEEHRVADYAAKVLAASEHLDDEAFLDLFHLDFSSTARQMAEQLPSYLDGMRALHSAQSDIRHIFTLNVARDFAHGYVSADRPDRLRSMTLRKQGRGVALGGAIPASGPESLLAVETVQAYLLDRWRAQD